MLAVSPSRIVIRQGDRAPALRFELEEGSGSCCDGDHLVEDVPAASTFSGWTLTAYGLTTVTIPLTVAADGSIGGAWPAASTDVPGTYQAILTATEILSSLPRTFPTVGAIELVIEPLPGP